jgi:hypothetical protein
VEVVPEYQANDQKTSIFHKFHQKKTAGQIKIKQLGNGLLRTKMVHSTELTVASKIR